MYRTRNAAYVEAYRGFESHPLRHRPFLDVHLGTGLSKCLNEILALHPPPCGHVRRRAPQSTEQTWVEARVVMRSLSRLSALFVGRAKEPGMYADGGGLYLQVSRSGTKSWIFPYAINGREREMGLGPLHTITQPMPLNRSARRSERQERRYLAMTGSFGHTTDR